MKKAFERHFLEHEMKRLPPQLDWDRIEELEKLKPIMRYCGSGGWADYGAFLFQNSELVVLETPLKGNATYIVGGDWKQVISLTKAEMREECEGNYWKVVHRGTSWRARVEKILGKGL